MKIEITLTQEVQNAIAFKVRAEMEKLEDNLRKSYGIMKIYQAGRIIVEQYCYDNNIEIGMLIDRNRTMNIVDHRSILVVILHKKGYTYNKIGETLHRDHSSIMSLERRAWKLASSDKKFRDQLNRALKRFNLA